MRESEHDSTGKQSSQTLWYRASLLVGWALKRYDAIVICAVDGHARGRYGLWTHTGISIRLAL